MHVKAGKGLPLVLVRENKEITRINDAGDTFGSQIQHFNPGDSKIVPCLSLAVMVFPFWRQHWQDLNPLLMPSKGFIHHL